MVKPTEMNGHTGDNEIGTPDDLFDWLNRRFNFNYDAFASSENHLCDYYSTIAGSFEEAFNRPEESYPGDGISNDWADQRVFWNPPYGVHENACNTETCKRKKCAERGYHNATEATGYEECIRKAIAERNNVEISVGLCKYDASTETGRLMRENFHLEYLPRIQYKGMTAPAPFASVIAINIPDRWKK